MARYLIGIDLGTTNTALAYVDLDRKPTAKGPELHTFQIPQLVAPGEARNQGARVRGRLVTSAKSWLCHRGVDRSAPLLPWSAPPDVARISPVEASARYLRPLAESRESVMAKTRE